MVVLNNARSANELLNQRSATTSERQSMQLIKEITGGLTLPAMPYGESTFGSDLSSSFFNLEHRPVI